MTDQHEPTLAERARTVVAQSPCSHDDHGPVRLPLPDRRRARRDRRRPPAGAPRALLPRGRRDREVPGGHALVPWPRRLPGLRADRDARAAAGPLRRPDPALPAGPAVRPVLRRRLASASRSPSTSTPAPDPLAPYAERTVRHLEETHADRVLAAVRVRLRPHALFAVPREIDRYGLGVTVMLSDGVETLRLPFAGGPVTEPVPTPGASCGAC